MIISPRDRQTGRFKCFLRLLFFLLSFSSAIAVPAAENAANRIMRVLQIDSYSSADLWTEGVKHSLRNYLAGQGMKVNYEEYQLGVLFQPGIKPAESDIEAVRAKMIAGKYDLIILSCNDATDLFLKGTIKPPEGTPLLSVSYSGDLETKIPKGMNMTGFKVPLQVAQDIEFAQRLLPEIRNFAFVTGSAANGRVQWELLKKARPASIKDVLHLSGTKYSTKELLEKIAALPKDTLLEFHSWSSSREDDPETSFTVLPRIRKIFPGLIMGRFESYIQSGSDGGVVSRTKELGETAGKIAARILLGERAGDIPVTTGNVHPILNYPALAKYNIPLANLPENTTLLNIPPSFITRYQTELAYASIITVSLLLLYIGNLLYRRRTHQRISLLFSKLPQRIVVLDYSGKVLYFHIPEKTIAGCPQPFRRLEQLPSPIQERFRASLEDFKAGKIVSLNYELNGQHRSGEFLPLPERNPFYTNAVMWISGDLTELHEAHQSMTLLAERFRLTLESIGDGVIATDREERITMINPVAARLTGFDPKETEGKHISEVFNIISYIDEKPIQSPLSKALADGCIVELANHTDLIARDGTRRHIADSAAPIRASDGTISGGVLVFRDVTLEYEQRDRERMNAMVLKNAAKLSKFTYFRYDGKQVIVPANPDFWPEKDGKPVPPEEWLTQEDVSVFKNNWTLLMDGAIPEMNIIYSTNSGSGVRYFEIRVERSRNDINGSEEFFGVIQDITTARENELRYRDNLHLLKTITNNLPGYIFVKNVDDNYRYVMCNSKFEEVTGVESRNIIGHFDNSIFSLDQDAAAKFRNDDKRVVESGVPLDEREIFTNVSGKRYIVRIIKNAISQSNGERLLIGMGIDISHQYMLEQAQEQTIRKLNDYINSEQIVNQSLTRITLENNLDKAINDMLRIIGENANADRCYIFLYTNDDLTRSDNVYEWVREGIEPQIDNLKNVDMTPFPHWNRYLREQRDIVISDIQHPPAEMEKEIRLLEAQNIRSLLVSGIRDGSKLHGYVGLDYTNSQKQFTDSDIHTVHNIANLYLLARERAQQLNRIADSVSLQRQIVDNISIPIAIIDLDFNIVTANPSLAAECGIPLEQLARTKCYDVICHCSEPPDWCPLLRTLKDSNMHSCEHEVLGRRQLITTQPLFDRQGKLMYVLKSEIDISEITRQKQELQKAMEQAQAADRAKSYFLATVSHELRTPLNAVIGFSELLQNRGLSPEDQVDYLQSINLAGNALLNLINDVLDLSKLEADQLDIVFAKTDVTALLKEVASVFKLKVKEKGIRLKLEMSGLEVPLYVDNLRLRQVLLNLTGNAVKFTHHGDVTIRAEFTPDGPAADTGVLTFNVSDTGIGISEENTQKIFDPFVQGESTRGNRVYEGSGLGLAISQRLVSKMGGTITVNSVPGKGSVFTVSLRQIKFDRLLTAGTETLPAANEGPDGKRYRVMLVDDVPMNLKVLQAMLRKLNVDSVVADSGPRALEILSTDPAFDLILTDLWMPGMNGSILSEKIKENPRTAKIPVIAVTADAQVFTELPDAFDSILLKPVTMEGLDEALRKHLGTL